MALDHDPHAGDDDLQLFDRIDALRVLRADSTVDRSAQVLWYMIGAAGDPPSDPSYHFALIAITLLVVAALAIPLVATAFLTQ